MHFRTYNSSPSAKIALLLRKTFAALYVDIKGAFAALQRCIIFQDTFSEESLMSFLSRQGFPPDTCALILEELRRYTHELEAAFSPITYALLRSLHQQTWFTVEGVKGVCLLYTSPSPRDRG